MLGHDPFGWNILRKYQVAFGTLFNDIRIVRTDAEGQQVVKVPLSYSRKEKILARLEGDPTLEKNVAISLPRMAFELVSMKYDATRKLRSKVKHVVNYANTAGDYKFVRNPVPYDLQFNLYIMAKYQQDGNQIIEQILPFFLPHFDMTIELIPEFDIVVDAPVTTDGNPTCEDTYDGQYKERRAIVWTLAFTMKAYLFGPERVYPIIKFANVNFYDATRHDDILDAVGNTVAIDRITTQPGQDANGHATTDLTITVPFANIEREEEWDYVINVAGSLVPGDIGNDGSEGET